MKSAHFFSILFSLFLFVSTMQVPAYAREPTKFKEACLQWQKKYANKGQYQTSEIISDYGGYGAEYCNMPDQSFSLRKTIGDRDISLSGLRINIFYGSEGEDLRRESFDYRVRSQKILQDVRSEDELSELIEIPNGAIVIVKGRGIIGSGIVSGIYTSRGILLQQRGQCTVDVSTIEAWNLSDNPPSTDPIYRKDYDNQQTHIGILRSIADDILQNPVCTEKTGVVESKGGPGVVTVGVVAAISGVIVTYLILNREGKLTRTGKKNWLKILRRR